MVWPTSGCSRSSATTGSSISSAKVLAGMARALGGFARTAGGQDGEAGLEEFRRLQREADQIQLAPRAQHLGAEEQHQRDHDERDGEDDDREPADLAQIDGSEHRQHHRDGRHEIDDVPVWRKSNGVEAEPPATAGLAAKRQHQADASISAPMAASATLSTVHHQLAKRRASRARSS